MRFLGSLEWRNPVLWVSIGLIVVSGGYLLHNSVQSKPDPVATRIAFTIKASECDRTRNPFRKGNRTAGAYYSCRMPSGGWRCVILKHGVVTDMTQFVRMFLAPEDKKLGAADFACA